MSQRSTKLSPPSWWRIFLLYALASGCVIMQLLILRSFKEGFLAKNGWWIALLSCIATATALAFSVIVLCKGRVVLYRTFVSAFLALFLSLLVLFIVLKTDFLTILHTPSLYQQFLEKTGAWMPILYILLQFLQVILLPIPSLVSTLAGIALFGALKTAIFSFLGIAAGSMLAFWIGKKFGFKVVAWLLGEEELKKWLKKVQGKDALALTMMFLLPLFPDDVLCFVAGLSTMSFGYFLAVMGISRGLAIFATCYSIDLIPLNVWWGWGVWAVLLGLLILLFVYLYKHLDKIQAKLRKKRRKTTQNEENQKA